MPKWSPSDLALSRPVTVGMALVAVVLLGLIGLSRMPLSFLPREQAARAYVRVDIARTSPEVLERELIRPLEEAVAGLRGVARTQVGSGGWGVRMNLEFQPGEDADARKLELRDRIDRVRGELPEFVTNIEIGSYTNADDPIMEVRLSSGTDLSQDYYLIEERIVRALERIDGVARIELDGVSPHELEIAVDLEAVHRTGVSLAELGAAVRDARQGHSMGVVRQTTRDAGVRSPSAPAEPGRFAALPLRRGADAAQAMAVAATEAAAEAAATEGGIPGAVTTAGATVVDTETGDDARFAALGEVARVRVHPEENRNAKRLNGRRAVNLEVFAAAGASVVEVSRAVARVIDELHADPALDGIEVLVVRDQGQIILKTLADLRDSGIYGGLLAMAVLFLFLHRLRTTVAAAVSVPLSVLAAGAVLFMRGEELNCVVLLGLVLGVGMLIDNAVVIVEAIAAQARTGLSQLEAARRGAREVGFATMASTLSTVIVFVPLIVNDPADELSTYLRPLGTTLAIGLVASLFVSQTSVPLLLGRLVRPSTRPTHHPVLGLFTRGYAWLIARTLRWPKLTLLLGVVLAASAAYPASKLELKLGRADIKPDHLPIRLEFSGSRNFEKIEHHVVVLEEALLAARDTLGVESVSCSYGDHRSSCRVYPRDAFESELEMAEFETRVRQALPEQVGVRYRVNESEFSWRDNTDRNVVEFAIKGDNMATLMTLSQQVSAHLERTLAKGDANAPDAGGFDLVTTPYTDGARELHVVLDGDHLRALGLSADDVASRVSLAFQGMPLGRVRGERGELRLRMSAAGEGEKGPGIEDVRDLRLPLPAGGEIPLGAVSEIEFERRPWWIQRVDRQTEVRLQVRFFNADPKANFELVSAAMADFVFPPGYGWGRGTQWRGQREANNDMLVNLGLCLLLVYAVMASLFESYLQPAGILVTCLLGAFGAPWALWLTQTTVDATAIVGLFILVGVVVNNGIMLIDRATSLRAGGIARAEALQAAGRDRLRPILMTVTTTILGLVPMLIHHPTLAGVYYHAIAIVITGGLLTSTLITLVFLPAAYATIEDSALGVRRGWRRFAGARRR
ncbi:MAG: efflux RND transporter permease subunit [Deltaproteobacteria bacterium]|nr:efflux RND transporter permease subunit [Deltaproteobacteria bacterium]